ncbi:TetR/AcrR family transcriptional regulator [Brevundimonas nasdae]|uniref:TetR/AcrR family transcriptional regulator n=1 Tax=Brevundimonas nasdae TaxID=172043 RepID=UPI003F692212
MGKRAEAKADTRSKAIEAAQRVWALPGNYDKHGVREIAVAMDMSTGAVFANFKSKAELWCAAFPGQPVPVDSPMTRLAPKMLALLAQIGALDKDELVLAHFAPALAEDLHHMLGQASMALELQQAA